LRGKGGNLRTYGIMEGEIEEVGMRMAGKGRRGEEATLQTITPSETPGFASGIGSKVSEVDSLGVSTSSIQAHTIS
jgi:hypothetical protein